MYKRWSVLLVMVILASLFIVGCSDDDDDTITSSITVPATFTNGEVYLYDGNGLYFYTYTYVHGGDNPGLDSIKVDTMSTVVYSSYYWNYADPYWYSDYYENADPSAYSSGDNITVSMYGGGRSSSCDITLLHYDDDATSIVSPSTDTTVDVGSSVALVWDKIDDAEYYAIYTAMRWDSSGTDVWKYDYTSTTDTTFTLSGDYTAATTSQTSFYVMPTSGPNPNSYAGNWTGTFTTGVLYSHADYTYVTVNVSSTKAAKISTLIDEEIRARDITAWDIIQGVYGLNR